MINGEDKSDLARCANGSHQMVLIPTALEDLIPQAHPVRLLVRFSTRLTGRRGIQLLGTKRSASDSSQHSGQGSSGGMIRVSAVAVNSNIN